MSKKKSRAWFICPQWQSLVAKHYPSDTAAAGALRTNPRILAKLRSETPVAKSTLLKALRQSTSKHLGGMVPATLVVDIRRR
jgi:hypothetical protein